MSPLRRLLGASAWLFADRFLRLGLSFVVGVLVARHYGPQEFGQISFVVATAAIFGSLSAVGLDDLVPRDFAQNRMDVSPDDIQHTAFILRLCGGGLAYLLLLLTAWWGTGLSLLFWIAVILGPYFMLQATDIYEYRLRVEGQFSAIAKTRAISSFAANALKVLVVWLSMPISLLAAAMTAEFGFNAAILRKLAQNMGAWGRGQFNVAYARCLLGRSWKIILAGTLAVAQTRIEYFLVEYFLGWDSVGQFAAALKIVELFDIVTMILVAIMLPEFARKYEAHPERTIRQAYLLGGLTVLMLVPVMVGAVWLFPLAYGDRFDAAYAVLPLLMLRPFFMMLMSVRNMLLVIEHRLWYPPLYAAIGVVVSLGVGLVLVPVYGLMGAVVCAVVSLMSSTLLADAMINRRNLAYILTCWREIPMLYRSVRESR